MLAALAATGATEVLLFAIWCHSIFDKGGMPTNAPAAGCTPAPTLRSYLALSAAVETEQTLAAAPPERGEKKPKAQQEAPA